ncbi:MAG: SigB/SigF/SigG family RNA polymerase sigma factor [Clostridia bacterium]|nr:SigB/SigF/SigG family RNA polymerase sigma factor [Clostridia bacterium]
MNEVLALIEELQKGNEKARTTLIETNLGLVHSIVHRFMNRGHEAEDLFQIGTIGLIKAIDRFDSSFDVKFSTYAVPMIIGEIKRFLRDDGIVKVSRSIKENAWKVRQAADLFMQEYGREGTMEELQSLTGLSKEDMMLALEAGNEVESIYKGLYQNEGQSICLVDKLPTERDPHEELVNHLLLEQLIAELDEAERKLIRLRYFENQTQMQVAGILGISQVQVSRQEKKILIRMREKVNRWSV